MAERLTPGVYVEEVTGGVRPIQGVGTSTVGFIGETVRGIPDRARFLTRFADFERAFGGHRRGPDGYLAQAVDAFFAAGGRRGFVVRVLPDDATQAQGVEPLHARDRDAMDVARDVLHFRASGRGAWADAVRIHIEDATGFPDRAFRIRVELTEGGRSRTVETFDDVRMDPDHEDYAARVVNELSQYVQVVDLFQTEFLDDPARDLPPVPATAPTLATRTNHITEAVGGNPAVRDYRVPVGARLQFSWRDAASGRHSDPEALPEVVFEDAALANATLEGDHADFTAAEFGAVLDAALGGDFRVVVDGDDVEIGPAVATPAYLVIRADNEPNEAFDLDGVDNLEFTSADAGGANPQAFDVPIAHPADDNLSAQTLADRLNAAVDASPGDNPHLVRAEAAGPYLVVRAGPVAAGVSLSVVASDGGGPVAPWPAPAAGEPDPIATVDGAGGLEVESFNLIQVSVSEVIQPGVGRVLAQVFPLARSTGIDENHPANPALRPTVTGDVPIRLVGGTDGAGLIGAAQYRGAETTNGKTGLRAFDTVDINMLVMPGRNSADFLAVGMAYCDRNDVFFVADGVGSPDLDFEMTADEVRQLVEGLPSRSNNAAMFYPWIEVPDPVGVGRNPRRLVPPSGHVAGIFARTDTSRGVWKAPAGIEAVVSGAVDLQHRLVDADQDLLNPIGLNCIRQFPNVGIVNWGARTLSSDPEWRYVPVRRTALFLKESLRRGLQWAVFEPNDIELWDRIRINISAFMLGLFRQGAFQGATPDEAFFAKCDRETNPQELVDQGIVTAEVAFAPLKPAEFVVVQISQKSLLTV